MNTDYRPLITFVANNDTRGDGCTAETMDYYMGSRYPWLSLAVPRLREMGYDVEAVSWQDDTVDWKSKRFAICGPVWGYSMQMKEFDSWLRHMQELRLPLHNSVECIRWNFNKTYLLDLQKNGIPIPPTRIIEPDSVLALEQVAAEAQLQWGTDNIIIKGVIDAGAFGYRHIEPGTSPRFEGHFADLKEYNGGVVVQPFMPEITRSGEYAFVFFDESLSHGFLKVPARGDERVQPFYNGRSFHFRGADIAFRDKLAEFRPDVTVPSPEEVCCTKKQAVEIRSRLASVLRGMGIAPPLYVRIDGIVSGGAFQVMEIEALEPYMELQEALETEPSCDADGKYVDAIHRRWQRYHVRK